MMLMHIAKYINSPVHGSSMYIKPMIVYQNNFGTVRTRIEKSSIT